MVLHVVKESVARSSKYRKGTSIRQEQEFGTLKPMDSFGMWWKSNEIIFLHWIIIL